jgi:hypothetical protein
MSRFLDPSLTHGQRCIFWSIVQELVCEDPPGSNRGPEISEWLRPCQRDGYGPEFGEHLARHGANWCAAFACAADRACRIDGEPPPVHGYRASGIELENDARACGVWRDASLVLSGEWEPAEGDLVIWQSGDGSAAQRWRRHVARFIRREPLHVGVPRWTKPGWAPAHTFVAIGGNERNSVQVSGGRHFNNPALLGFIELPRRVRIVRYPDEPRPTVTADEPNIEVLRRAVDLERRLWSGVVGMDAFDELMKELEAVDPREW